MPGLDTVDTPGISSILGLDTAVGTPFTSYTLFDTVDTPSTASIWGYVLLNSGTCSIMAVSTAHTANTRAVFHSFVLQGEEILGAYFRVSYSILRGAVGGSNTPKSILLVQYTAAIRAPILLMF